jgi:hypothetical protein
MKEAVIENVTGLYSNGEVDDIYNKIKILLKTNFNKNKIINHAMEHDYKKHLEFIDFIRVKCEK